MSEREFRKQFALRLRDTREFFAELTQEELAKKAGTTAITISHYECGKRMPGIHQLAKLAKAMDTNADYMLGLD